METEHYRVEEELLGRTPRRVARVGNLVSGMAGVGCMQLFILPFIAVGVGMLLFSIGGTLVAAGGSDMPGSVTARRDTSDSDGNSYKVDFTYRRGDDLYSGSSNVSSDDYQRLEPGSNVTVQALSWAPSILPAVREASESRNKSLIFFWGFSILWNALISVFVWAIFVWPIIARRLIADGTPVAARLIEKKADSSDDSTTYTLLYEFAPEMGFAEPVKGKMTVTREQWESVASGDVLTALYIPLRPHWSVLYKFADYRAAAD
ncbi:MAG: hypothetical protein ABIY70_13905 [Capsulimonas sp.]|uniref:hypothetical protein n=1 Tax=Capsulimonas sp. TaxID=2494211 RepID=UPI003267DC83